MRLIDADALTAYLADYRYSIPNGYKASPLELAGYYAVSECIDAIQTAPTVDAVEIVRCGDCKHYNETTKGCFRNPSVERWTAKDFCNYGEKKQ